MPEDVYGYVEAEHINFPPVRQQITARQTDTPLPVLVYLFENEVFGIK